MKTPIKFTTLVSRILILSVLSVFALCPLAQAVSPAPDGGYAGGNTAEGTNALLSLASGTYNTAVGIFSLESDITGSFNTGVGAATLLSNTGDQNTATGAAALLRNSSGTSNTADGAFALASSVQGIGNTAMGSGALSGLNNGSNNVAIGYSALSQSFSGSCNVAIGENAGTNLTGTDQGNIDIGSAGVAGDLGTIRIGAAGIFACNQGKAFIAGINGTPVTGTAVVVSGNGQLGVAPSSQRFKTDIKPIGRASETILALKPVTFRYKKEIDPEGIPQFGLVAEDVERVNAALVKCDADGKPYTVRYDAVSAMLLNEFLKEHKIVEEQQATIEQLKSNTTKQEITVTELQKDVGILTTQLKQQAAQIQNVSTQIQTSKPASKVVLND